MAIALRTGIGLRESRTALRLTQAQAADGAGVSQPFWSRLERGLVTSVSIETLASCGAAVAVRLAMFIEARPGATLPRDIEHLRRQQLVITVARPGGWEGRPEVGIDPAAAWSRSIDVQLARSARMEIAVVEIVDLIADGGSAMRGLSDKVASVRRSSPPGTHVAGLLILRATSRNRATMKELSSLFEARFPGSSAEWYRALESSDAPMPLEDGILWSSVSGDRLMTVVSAKASGAARTPRR